MKTLTGKTDSLGFQAQRATLFNGLFWIVIAYLSVYKLWMVSAMPFFIPMFSPEDGTWFFKKALSISTGEWFGTEYGPHTLIKLPMYPLYLAGIAELGIHPKLANDLLYIGSSLIFVLSIRNVLYSRLAIIFAFVIVLFNPLTLSDYWITLLRLNLFIPLVLVYLSSLIALIAQSTRKQPTFSIYWLLTCASSLTLAWYTREEAVWMLSGFAPLILISLFSLPKKQLRIRLFTFWVVIILAPFTLGQYFSSINQDRYGFNGVIDTRAPEFNRALNAIFSLNTADNDSYNYMTFETRDKLETISQSTYRLISPLIDRENGNYSNLGSGIGGSYASWAIRSSMASNGYYSDPESTEAEYKKIADDIEIYCRNDPGACQKTYVSGVLVKPVSVNRFIERVKKGGLKLLNISYIVPADRTNELQYKLAKTIRGDTLYRYTASRYFNANMSWDADWDQRNNMPYIERNKNKKIKSFFRNYQEMFYIWFFIALFSFAISVFMKGTGQALLGLMFFGLFGGSYSVYLLVTLFAVPNLDRLLAISSISLISFTALYFALFIQTGVMALVSLPRKYFKRCLGKH